MYSLQQVIMRFRCPLIHDTALACNVGQNRCIICVPCRLPDTRRANWFYIET